MTNIVVMVSGNGSDLQSIIDNINNGNINGRIVLVISSSEDAYALKRAELNSIDTMIFNKEISSDKNIRNLILLNRLKEVKTDLIVLAGYIKIIDKLIIDAYPKKIINIHPSLIPAHCGKGYYGLKVHESVIESKDKFSGVTIHYVDEHADTGEIIYQEAIEVSDDDTAISLQKKVLEKEHEILPQIVAKLCNRVKNEKSIT